MVVKTEVCSFSEQRIYPGKGIRLITREGKLAILQNRRCKQFFVRKVKGQVIRWTVTWRRLNKKLSNDETVKRKKRRTRKAIKDVVGLEREEIRRKRNMTNEEREAQREQAIREIKQRKEKERQAKKPQAEPKKDQQRSKPIRK